MAEAAPQQPQKQARLASQRGCTPSAHPPLAQAADRVQAAAGQGPVGWHFIWVSISRRNVIFLAEAI